MKTTPFSLLILALFVASPVEAKYPWLIRTWQSDEGLPDNSVAGICQTPDNFLWVAARTGLVRFDGLQFRQIQLPGDNRLAAGQAIVCDKLGRLWIAKDRGGVIRMDGKGIVKCFSSSEGLPDKEVRRIAEDGEGCIWVSFFTGEVVRIRDNQVRQFTREDGLPGGETCYLAPDQTGQLWFTQGGWLGLFRKEKFQPLFKLPPERTQGERIERIARSRVRGLWVCLGNQLYTCSEKEGLVLVGDLPTEASEAEPTVLYEDRTGRLWIGTRQADLFSFDGKVFEKTSTSHQTITVVAEDREGNIWAGTRGFGLKKLSPRVVTLMPKNATIPFEGVRSLSQDTAGRLWVIAEQKRTVLYSEGEDWVPLTAEDGWMYSDADCLAADPSGGVWIGTSYQGLHRWQDGKVTASFSTTNGLAMENVSALLTTPEGAVWVGLGSYDTTKHALQRLRAGELMTFPLPVGSGEVTALAAGLKGDCWVGTSNGQLLRVHDDHLTVETGKAMRSQPCEIRSLLVTSDGALWIGYGGHGLGRLKGGRFAQCRMSEGLPDDYLSLLLQDNDDRLWIAGNRGIFRLRKKDIEEVMEGRTSRVWPVIYRQKEGLAGVQASSSAWPGALRSTDGRLLFAMQSGLAAVYPDRAKEASESPAVVVERINVSGQMVAAYREAGALTAASVVPPVELARDGVSLHLPASRRRQVEFVFTAPNFTMPQSIGFKYRLQGLDTAWVDAGSKRSAVYALIPPGHYRFQVIACNSDGNWSGTGASLELTVAYFWWETAWFQGASLVALIALLGGGLLLWSRRRYHFKLERLKVLQATERERMRIAQDLHDDLGANLTQIAYLGDTLLNHSGLPSELSSDIEKMRTTAREATRALDETVWAVDPGQDTLEGLAGYLAFFAQDYLEGAQLSCRLDIPETLPPLCVPSEVRHHLLLVFKEILTNIIRHARATVVDIRFAVEGIEGVLCITDNGCGFEVGSSETRPGGGHGMASIHKRLAAIGGHCDVQSQLGSGTKISLRWRFQ